MTVQLDRRLKRIEKDTPPFSPMDVLNEAEQRYIGELLAALDAILDEADVQPELPRFENLPPRSQVRVRAALDHCLGKGEASPE